MTTPALAPSIRLRATARRLIGDQSGVSLPELLVVCLMFAFVLAAVEAAIVPSIHQQGRTARRNGSTQEASIAVERMSREIRDATSITVGGSGSPQTPSGRIDLVTSGQGGATLAAPQRVIYDCTSGACTRASGAVGGALGAPVSTVAHVTNPTTVFSAPAGASNPPYVSLKLDVTLGSGFSNPVELQDGVTVMNLAP